MICGRCPRIARASQPWALGRNPVGILGYRVDERDDRTTSVNPKSPDQDFEIFGYQEAFYIVSLLFCTESALGSALRISDLLNQHKGGRFDFPPQPALDELQNIALQGAGISRFFWPPNKKHSKRGEILRKAFVVTEQSPLRSRDLRNRMEHFDEYLDDFLKTCIAGQFIPDYFGPKPPDDRGPLRFFRAYFVNTGEFEILGSIFVMQPIVNEIRRLHGLLIECEKAGSRFPRQS